MLPFYVGHFFYLNVQNDLSESMIQFINRRECEEHGQWISECSQQADIRSASLSVNDKRM